MPEGSKKISRQERRRRVRDRGKVDQQDEFNRVLWKVLEINGGSIQVPVDDLKSVPVNAAITSRYDADTDSVIITAMLREVKQGPRLVIPEEKRIIA